MLKAIGLPASLFIGTAAVIIAIVGVSHVLINRRDPRAALWWTGVICSFPFLGCLFYYLFGINRIQRKLLSLSRRRPALFKAFMPLRLFSRRKDQNSVSPKMRHLFSLAKISEQVTQRPLLYGNEVTALRNGDAAYPVMIDAIDAAKRSVSLSTYIFKFDEAGQKFVDALCRAKKRGVEVRVLMDDLGSGVFFSKVGRILQQSGIPVATFMPALTVSNLPYLNLRNHRKLLIVDGRVGFCGGMNIHKENLVRDNPDRPTHDFHFKIEGPSAAQLQEAFVEDWFFCAKEELQGRPWFPKLYPVGTAFCRGIADGPDENFERLRWILLGAITVARESIHIVSPYFIPDQALLNALSVAALRGVKVHIVVPGENDWAMVSWASMGFIAQVLDKGCRVWASPPPFDHSKLMLVDGGWTLFGSSNWDTRSLRLNFEFNVECYDENLTQSLMAHVRDRIKNGRELTRDQLENRSFPVKLRDGMARLFTPHL